MDTPPPLQPEPTSGRRKLRRTPPFQFLNSDGFAIFFLIISLCFIFIVLISPFYSFNFHFVKPQFTRKSLDFLSMAMVLFAIACGLMSKNNGENRAHEEIYRASNTSSNDSQFIDKSNPLLIPNQWSGYQDRTDQILLHHPSPLAGVEYWRLSGEDYITNFQAPNSDSVQHCLNSKHFEDVFDFKRGKFSVYDDEISSSSSALFQYSVPPMMTPPLFSSPPVMNPPPLAVVEVELDEPPSLRLEFQEFEDEMRKTEKHREFEGNESKGIKKNKKKSKMKKWQKGIGNSSSPPAPAPPVGVHHHRDSCKIVEMRRDFPLPPQSPPPETNALRTHRNCTGGEPAAAAELEIKKTKIGMFCGSPDVNSKADNFIETFRAGLKLERMNSINQRQTKTKTSILGRKGPSL